MPRRASAGCAAARALAGGADFGDVAKQNLEDASAPRAETSGGWRPATRCRVRARHECAAPGESQPAGADALGWHLVQVIERRSEELSDDRKKVAAKQAIRARKADEAYQDWLRQSRDRAFVENRYDERQRTAGRADRG